MFVYTFYNKKAKSQSNQRQLRLGSFVSLLLMSHVHRALERPNEHNGPSWAELEEETQRKEGTTLLNTVYISDDEIAAAASESEEEEEEGGEEEEEKVAGAVAELDLESEEEEEEEKEQDGREEKEEDEEDEENKEGEKKSQEQILDEFVEHWCKNNVVVRGQKWPAWREGLVMAAVLDWRPKLHTMLNVVINRIKAKAGEKAIAEAQAAAAAQAVTE
jgi:cobalamin biosynthesis protein CobT